MPCCAPGFRQLKAAASHPTSSAFLSDDFSTIIEAKAPTNVSPAPVVSTGLMLGAGARKQASSAVTANAPCAPAVTTQVSPPDLASQPQAASKSVTPASSAAARSSASCSFTMR